MRFISTGLITLLILVAIMWPGSGLPHVNFIGIDKLVHFGLFTLWTIAIRNDLKTNFRWHWVLLGGLLFSTLTEVLQILAKGRNFDVYDIMADVAGVIFGILIGNLFLKIMNRIISR